MSGSYFVIQYDIQLLHMTTSIISARLTASSAALLCQLAKKHNKPKSRIVEDALLAYGESEIRSNIRSSYAMVGRDPEMLELADLSTPEFVKSY